MKVNPQTLSWDAPTENVDGAPIDYEMAYDLGVRTGVETEPTSLASFPGSLNPDGRYEAPLPAMALVDDVEYFISLRAFPVTNPSASSVWSNEVSVLFTGKVPNAPALFAAS